MKKIIVIVGLLSCCIFATVACQAKSNIEEAETCIKIERFNDASVYLQKAIMQDKLTSATHYKAGVIYSQMGIDWYGYADQCLRVAAKLGYDSKAIADQYKHNADVLFFNKDYASAEEYYCQTIIHNSELKNDIIQNYEEKIRYNLQCMDTRQANNFIQCLLKIDSELIGHLYDMVIDYGNMADDAQCGDLYLLGLNLCNSCDRNEATGQRLKTIADRIEQSIFDPKLEPQQRVELYKKVENYKEVARKFVFLPPSVKSYEPGEYIFSLAPGQILDHWIYPSGNQDLNIKVNADNRNCERIYSNGSLVRYWNNEKAPQNCSFCRFKFRSIKDSIKIMVEISPLQR